MKLSAVLLVVSDMERSRRFYENVLLQKVIMDFGDNIVFESGLSLQTKSSWPSLTGIPEDDIRFCGKDAEIYFEDDDFDLIAEHLKAAAGPGGCSTDPDSDPGSCPSYPVRYVHDIKGHPWGQRVIRIYDPDGHIIEIGESMESVIMKFLASGMTIEEAAEKSQYPEEFVKECFIKQFAPKRPGDGR